MSRDSSTMTSTQNPPTVALIGCGPSGMFFLHALAIRRARLEEEGNAEGIAALPVVTCFERSSGPGGVWRSDRFSDGDNGGDGKSTNMYEALWTNGPKEAMEFFDHTYLEHFGCAMPTFLPRQCVLEYLLARCTKNNPNFFRDVKFNTNVKSVEYDTETDKFIIDISEKNKSSFDMCIWAAGLNGKPKIPPSSIEAVLTSGGFKGAVMHSSQTDSNFDQYVRGKNVVMIGGEFSAEDLALQAIKLGVESVEIVTRAATGIATDTSSWPMDKVDVNEEYVPTGVTDDGRGIVLSKLAYDFDQDKYVVDSGRPQITLDHIDTIIFCTGYEANFDMLDGKMKPCMEPFYSKDEVPKGSWKMSKNPLSKELGDIPLDNIRPEFGCVLPDMYRGRLISNPSMFFMFEGVHLPLFDLDIAAWRTLAQITGDLPLPPPGEIHRFNMETVLDSMNDPLYRYLSDYNYEKHWKEAFGDDHWSEDYSDRRMKVLIRNFWRLQYRLLARDALDSGYPLDIGRYEKLNKKGEALVLANVVGECARYDMDAFSKDSSWRTFRDCDPSKCRSIFTGTKSVPLKCHWLELESCDIVDIIDQTAGEKKCSSRVVPVAKSVVDKLRSGIIW